MMDIVIKFNQKLEKSENIKEGDLILYKNLKKPFYVFSKTKVSLTSKPIFDHILLKEKRRIITLHKDELVIILKINN